MKSFIFSFFILSAVLSSCQKESTELVTSKKKIFAPDEIISSSTKIKQTNLGTTLEADLNSKTGEVTISSVGKSQITIWVKYQSHKSVNDVFVPNSSINWGKYTNPFVVSNFSSINPGTNHKLDLEVKTSSGSSFIFNFIHKKK